jgi:tetratricopeptide (TPR) repeat protein
MTRILVSAFAFVLLVLPAAAQTSAPPPCFQPATGDAAMNRRYDNCTEIILRVDHPAARSAAYASRGWIELARRANDKAIADFSAAITLNPELDWALAGRAMTYLNSDKPDLAVADYDRVLSRHPNDVQMLIGRGDAYNNLRQYEQGIADFDRALQIAPTNDEAMNDRAWALLRLGRVAEAITGYDQALQHATRLRGTILENRCTAKAVAGDIEAALADCEAAEQIDPVEHSSGRGLVYLVARRYAEAIAAYDTALARFADSPSVLYGRGVARLRMGQVEGRADLDAAQRLHATIREAMADLGITAP